MFTAFRQETAMRCFLLLILLLAAVHTDARGQAATLEAVSALVAPASRNVSPARATQAAIVVAASSTPLQGRPSTFWLNAGVGVSRRGAAGIAGGSYQFGANLLSVRGAGTVAMFGDELWDLGVLYGRATRPGIAHLSLAAGAGIVGGARPAGGSIFDPTERIPTTITLPIEAQLFFRPTGILGVGLYGFASLNEEESFGGVALAVQLGRLW